MIFADTGFFVALVRAQDELHHRAKAWIDAISAPILITDAIVLETINAISNARERPKASPMMKAWRQPRFVWIPVTPPLLAAGIELHQARPDKAWSLTDCISFVVMQQRSITRALAFDIHFEQAGFEALLRRDP